MDIGIVILIITIFAMAGIGYYIYFPPEKKIVARTPEQLIYIREFKRQKAEQDAQDAAESKAKVSLETSQAATLAAILKRQTITNTGYNDTPGHLIRGWYDVQKQGALNDYCAYIGNAPGTWYCALAGGNGFTPASEYGTPAERVPEKK